MGILREWIQRLWGTLHPRRRDADLEEELRLHLELAAEDARHRGLPAGGAVRAARIRSGGARQAMDALRDQRGLPWLEDVLRDLQYGLRALRRKPMFASVAILTLALGIGANTALFTIMRAVLFTTLPVERPEELVEVACFRVGAEGYDPCHASYPGFRTYVEAQRSLSGMFGFWPAGDLNADIDGSAELVRGLLLSGAAYGTLGLRPSAGRLLDTADDARGAPIVAVLSDQFWQRRFGRDPGVLGRTIRINNQVVTIVGVTPASFRGVSLDETPDVTLPLSTAETFRRRGSLTAGAAWWVRIVGRLAPGVSLERAQTELEPVYRRTLEQTLALLPREAQGSFRQFIEGYRFRLRPAEAGADSYLRGYLDRPLQILSAISLMVLVIACANLTGVQLSRTMERRKEFGIRLALGAGRTSLVRQVIVECLVLASIGGAAGLALGTWIGPTVLAMGAGASALRAVDVTPDAMVLAFTTVVSVACGLVVSIAAVVHAGRTAARDAWRPSGGAPNTGLLTRVLIAGQVAVAIVLLTGAALFVRSLVNLRNVDTGFDTDNVITLTVAPGLAGYDSPRRLFYLEEAVASLKGLPGVASATFLARPIGAGVVSQTGIGVPGFRSGRQEDTITGQNRVGPRFVETLGLTLLRGRDLMPGDRPSSSTAVVVNESFAVHFYGTTDVVGRQFLLPWGDTASVVGVVRDARDRSIALPPERWMYLPFAPEDVGQSSRILVRARGDASTMLAALPRALANLDRAVPIYDVQTLTAQLEGTLGTRRLLAVLGQSFGGVALLLVAVGLYGLLSGLVTRRTREIGVRIALGARRAGIGWLCAREALVVIVPGLVAGLVSALGASRFVRAQLFGVAPTDPWAIAAATAVLLAAGGVAVWVPTRRAVGVDPMVTLRYE